MSLLRPLSWTLLAAGGFALLGGPAAGRQPPKDDLPVRPRNAGDIPQYKQYTIPPAKMKEAKETFAAYGNYLADYLSLPRMYTAPQEFRPDPLPKNSPAVPKTLDDLFRYDIDPLILVPEPGSKVGPNDADYIREFGAALDDALGKLPKAGESVVAVNGARALAAACRSGATAHYPTVTALLTNENVRPEAKHYLFQAAGNLLAAHDLNNYTIRKHSAAADKPEQLAALVAALQKAVEDPAAILPLPAGADGKPAPLPEDMVPVLQFIRRQAIKALGQCRFAEIPGAAKGQTLYPSFTLARVAMSDPALGVPPAPAEVAEAVIGLCNMSPPRALGTEPYAYAMADAVATGLIGFASPKFSKAEDKSIAWRGYAGRLADALQLWQALYDANYSPQNPAAAAPDQTPAVVKTLASEATRRLLGPMESGNPPDLNGFRQYLDTVLRPDKKNTGAPYRDNPALVLPRKGG